MKYRSIAEANYERRESNGGIDKIRGFDDDIKCGGVK